MRTSKRGEDFITSFEGVKLQAYQCSARVWTIWIGCTKYPDGSPVLQGDELDSEDEARELFQDWLVEYEQAVERSVKVPLEQHQFDALVSLAFNIGSTNFATSTLLSLINSGQMARAAHEFEAWHGQSSAIPAAFKVGPEPDSERARGYFSRTPGLLRRRLSEACMFLGYDWKQACARESIHLSIKTDRRWNQKKARWEELVMSQTRLKDVIGVAEHYPLPPIVDAPLAIEPLPEIADIEEFDLPDPDADDFELADDPIEEPEPEPVPTPAPVPVVVRQPVGTKPIDPDSKRPADVPYKIDPDAPLKPMEKTERFIGAALLMFGTLMRALASNGIKLTGFIGAGATFLMQMMETPQGMAILVSWIAAIVTGGFGTVWLVGLLTQKRGAKVKERGETSATQGMF